MCEEIFLVFKEYSDPECSSSDLVGAFEDEPTAKAYVSFLIERQKTIIDLHKKSQDPKIESQIKEVASEQLKTLNQYKLPAYSKLSEKLTALQSEKKANEIRTLEDNKEIANEFLIKDISICFGEELSKDDFYIMKVIPSTSIEENFKEFLNREGML